MFDRVLTTPLGQMFQEQFFSHFKPLCKFKVTIMTNWKPFKYYESIFIGIFKGYLVQTTPHHFSVSCNYLPFTRPFRIPPFRNVIASFCEKCHFGHIIWQRIVLEEARSFQPIKRSNLLNISLYLPKKEKNMFCSHIPNNNFRVRIYTNRICTHLH